MESVLFKTRAVCLSVRPFSKTSQMVAWFTPDYGLVTTPIKGALRPKSGFVGQYGLAYTCELVFYAHERNGIHQIRECAPLNFREALRTQWQNAAVAAYLCDLTLRTTHPGLVNADLFFALETVLDELQVCAVHEAPLALLWFESNLLNRLGVSPDFSYCSLCPEASRHNFSVNEGYFYCEHRPSHLVYPETLSLNNEVVERYRHFLREPLGQILEEARTITRGDPHRCQEPFPGLFGLRRFLGVFLARHLELFPGTRRTMWEILFKQSR